MRALVLGSGIIGVTTAYALHKKGWQVTVIDRQPGPAMETSAANGGQLSFSHAEPWATPSLLMQLPGWLLSGSSPVRMRMTRDRAAWQWGASFLRQCMSIRKSEETTHKLFQLALESKQAYQAIQQEVPLRFHHRTAGTLHLYSSKSALDKAEVKARHLGSWGCQYQRLQLETLLKYEPALAGHQRRLAGAINFMMDESGDARLFAKQLQKWLINQGVRFDYNVSVKTLMQDNDGKKYIQTSRGQYPAECIVVAMGAQSQSFFKELGINVPFYSLKGYSITLPYPHGKEHLLPTHALTDNRHKLVYSRLGDRLRVAGLADMGDTTTDIMPGRIAYVRQAVKGWFPYLAEQPLLSSWAGLRPATPSGLPIIGRTAIDNVFINTGHGTLGWTLAAGSAQRIANLAGEAAPSQQVVQTKKRAHRSLEAA